MFSFTFGQWKNQTYNKIWLQSWLSEAVSPMKSLAEESTRCLDESTLKPDWLEMDMSSSPEELELGFWWGCHGFVLLLHEEREFVRKSGHQLGVAEEVAIELSVHSPAILMVLQIWKWCWSVEALSVSLARYLSLSLSSYNFLCC